MQEKECKNVDELWTFNVLCPTSYFYEQLSLNLYVFMRYMLRLCVVDHDSSPIHAFFNTKHKTANVTYAPADNVLSSGSRNFKPL